MYFFVGIICLFVSAISFFYGMVLTSNHPNSWIHRAFTIGFYVVAVSMVAYCIAIPFVLG